MNSNIIQTLSKTLFLLFSILVISCGSLSSNQVSPQSLQLSGTDIVGLSGTIPGTNIYYISVFTTSRRASDANVKLLNDEIKAGSYASDIQRQTGTHKVILSYAFPEDLQDRFNIVQAFQTAAPFFLDTPTDPPA